MENNIDLDTLLQGIQAAAASRNFHRLVEDMKEQGCVFLLLQALTPAKFPPREHRQLFPLQVRWWGRRPELEDDKMEAVLIAASKLAWGNGYKGDFALAVTLAKR